MIASTSKRHGKSNEKKVNKPHYYIPDQPSVKQIHYDAISFFSEIAPCGVIGSFVLDKLNRQNDIFLFKHHFINIVGVEFGVSAEVYELCRGGDGAERILLVGVKERHGCAVKRAVADGADA